MEGIRVTRNERQGQDNSSITAVQTVNGDIYKCVDIHKLPAFQRAAFAGQPLQMRPAKEGEKYNLSFENIWKDNKSCPLGTVPIPELGRARDPTLQMHFNNASKANGFYDFTGIIVKRPAGPGKGYLGASAIINIYKPDVKDHQASSASIIIENGDNQIQAGWTVNPDLYGDKNARFYTSWTSGSTGCVNVRCPGFVILSQRFPLDYAFQSISEPGARQYDIKVYISQATKLGDWYLMINEVIIGYWPGKLFGTLGNGAETIRLGGQVSSPGKKSPPMGSGEYGDVTHTCYMNEVVVNLNDYATVVPDESLIQHVISHCYYEGHDYVSKPPAFGYNFVFGGEGGIIGLTCL